MNSQQKMINDFYSSRIKLETRVIQLMLILGGTPDYNTIKSKTDNQLTSTSLALKSQFMGTRSQWPELYTSMVFRLSLGREPTSEELNQWSFELTLTGIDGRLFTMFGKD